MSQLQQPSVGVREFRENLSSIIEGTETVTITKHGQTIGFYIPAKPCPSQQQLDSLTIASGKMRELLSEMNVSEDELLEEFKAAKKQAKSKKNDE